MPYIVPIDFLQRVQPVHLTQITSADPRVIADTLKIVVDDVRELLVQKYDMDRELTETESYDAAKIYPLPARVYYTSGAAPNQTTDIYYAKLPAAEFDFRKTYRTGEFVFWIDRKYKALQAIPANGLNPDLIPDFWLPDVAASTVAAGQIGDATKWIKGDNRCATLVSNMVDICLYHVYSRISPNNVPVHRTDRHNAAVTWLQQAGTGDRTVNLPRLNPLKKGARIRSGSQPKNINRY